MKLTEGRLEGGNLVVALFGHVDTSNAKQVEQEIHALREQNPGGAVCYVSENRARELAPGMAVAPVRAESALDDSAMHLGGYYARLASND